MKSSRRCGPEESITVSVFLCTSIIYVLDDFVVCCRRYIVKLWLQQHETTKTF